MLKDLRQTRRRRIQNQIFDSDADDDEDRASEPAMKQKEARDEMPDELEEIGSGEESGNQYIESFTDVIFILLQIYLGAFI